MKVLCVCVVALLECDPLFLCCCSFAAVHIMSSHLLLSHSRSLFFPPLISLPVLSLLPIAQTELRGRSHESVTGAQPPPLSAYQEKSSLEIQSNFTVKAAKRTDKKLLPSSIRTVKYMNLLATNWPVLLIYEILGTGKYDWGIDVMRTLL